VSPEKGQYRKILNSALIAAWAILMASVPSSAGEYPSQFDAQLESTRSRAMGGALSALGDDVSSIFINPAGLVTTGGTALYGDFGSVMEDNHSGDWKVAAGFERYGFVFGGGVSGCRDPEDQSRNQFFAGVAKNLTTGSAGSFLSVGAAVRVGRLSFDMDTECGTCPPARHSGTEVTADLGLMIRPLPFISLSLSSENIMENGFDIGSVEIPWERMVRFGVAWLHENRFVVSWEGRYGEGRDTGHFGLSLKTGLPLDIMAGMTEERISGGMRWDGGRWRFSVAFSQEDREVIHTAGSFELFFGRPVIIHQ
jgi:hypothetical protein